MVSVMTVEFSSTGGRDKRPVGFYRRNHNGAADAGLLAGHSFSWFFLASGAAASRLLGFSGGFYANQHQSQRDRT
jgi:hypothetical protein